MLFSDKLRHAILDNQSLLYVGLDPIPEFWAACYQELIQSRKAYSLESALFEQPSLRELKAWLHFLITETADVVCAYKLNPEFYRLMGTVGLELMHQLIRLIPAHIPIILDAKHSDLNSNTLVAQTFFQDKYVDAITLTGYVGQELAVPFLLYPEQAIFVLCATTNPTAQDIQTYPNSTTPFYLHLVNEVRTWGRPEQVGLEVGAVSADRLARIRAAAPERLILARSVWTEHNQLSSLLEAGLTSEGDGLIIPVPLELLVPTKEQKFLSVSEPIQTLNTQVNHIRDTVSRKRPSCSVWFSDVCLLGQPQHEDLILQLYDMGCLQFGDFVQASGATFPYYIDLRAIISNPQVFDKVLDAYAKLLIALEFDRIAGIPYGALPTATGLALRLNYPMIFPRKEVKAHGARRLVEGHYHTGETAVVVDDILISGNSAMEGANKLETVGLTVRDIVVFIDHENGVMERLNQNHYQGHAVLTLSAIATTLFEAGRLTEHQLQMLGQ